MFNRSKFCWYLSPIYLKKIILMVSGIELINKKMESGMNLMI